MRKSRKTLLVVALVCLAALITAGIVLAATATSRQMTISGTDAGEVLIGNKVVIRFRAEAYGKSPLERAQQTAERLNVVFGESDSADQFSVKSVEEGKAIYGGNQIITEVRAADAQASDTTISALALAWRDNIVRALGGETPPPETVEETAVDWEGADEKLVPILDVGNRGVRIGAAQVAGPAVQVAKCKAVAQLELDFKRNIRVKAYVPIDSYNVIDLNRVQGVSVWAVGDIRILEF